MDDKLIPGLGRSDSAGTQEPAASGSIERNIKSPGLKRLYLRWRQLLLDGADLPGLRAFDFDNDEMSPHGFVVAVEGDGFRYIFVGDALVKRLGRSPVGETVDGDAHELLGSLQATYRQCRTQQAPHEPELDVDGRFRQRHRPSQDTSSCSEEYRYSFVRRKRGGANQSAGIGPRVADHSSATKSASNQGRPVAPASELVHSVGSRGQTRSSVGLALQEAPRARLAELKSVFRSRNCGAKASR